jgi:hypothetical protein
MLFDYPPRRRCARYCSGVVPAARRNMTMKAEGVP